MINITSKDKSIILLITLCGILLWLIVSVFFVIYDKVSFKNSEINKINIIEKNRWLNVVEPLSSKDLSGKITILHFWSSSCVSCIEAIDKLKELDVKYPNTFAIIGVHNPLFENEENYLAVKKAVIRFDINYPVINDSDRSLSNKFAVQKTPTFIIFSLSGKVHAKLEGIDKIESVINQATKLYYKNKFSINHNKIPIVLERDVNISNILSNPTKIIYVSKFFHKNREIPAIIIANSGQNSIIITNINGEIIAKIGSGVSGFSDGNLNNAQFRSPQSIAYSDKKIFVADTGNNSLRLIDFENNTVKTLIGSGMQGEIITSKKINLNDDKIDLFAPTDIEFFPDKSTLIISNSGTNQILAYNPKDNQLLILAGNGEIGEQDGVYPDNSLAQTSDMAVCGDKLYLLDALTSNLRVIDKDGSLQTLYKSKDEKNSRIKLQNPRGLVVDDTGAYISDSLNHAIKKFDFNTKQLSTIVGGPRGEEVGTNTSFDEPNGLFSIIDKFYIADSNNNRILEVNRASGSSELLDIMPQQKLSKEAFLEYLPNLQKSPDIELKALSDIIFTIKIKDGWKINPHGPSFMNLLELNDENSATLVYSFDWNEIISNKINFPKLKDEHQYLLQGKIYFCRNSTNALCYIKSYEQKIIAKQNSDISEISIEIAK